jgi:uncharacterized protein
MNLRGVLLGLAGAGLMALGGLVMLQDRLLYFPARAMLAEVATGDLAPWPAAHGFRGLLAQPQAAVRGTAILFHGNAGHAGQRAGLAMALARTGLRVILAEYPGYGPRDGALGEASLVEDAVASLALAHQQFGAPLLVVGESLGAGVAAAAAARQRDRVAGLMLITPWDRLHSVASLHYPWLPVQWLLRERYDSAAILSGFDRPVVVAVAEHDEIVPARLGTALHDGLRAPKRLLVIPGAGHNDWPTRVDALWWQQAVDFMLGAPTPA